MERLPAAARAECLRDVLSEAKGAEDVATYKAAAKRLGSGAADEQWLAAAEARAAARTQKLEAELNGYRADMIKESIRMGHNDLGEHHYERGDLQAAFKCFVRTRDYCTSSKHLVGMCLSVVRVSLELGNFLHVANYVQKAEATPDKDAEPLVQAKLGAAMGLANLAQKKYRLAARTLCAVPAEIGTSYNDVIAPQDIATYGALCALATFDRSELKARVLNSVSFRALMELVPNVREVVHDFHSSRYALCLGALAELKNDLLMDLHLAEHVEELYEMIRHRALIQYATPFSSVDLERMATAFHTGVPELMKELAALIGAGKIKARIDSQGRVLHRNAADQRAVAFQKALAAGDSYHMQARAALLRASLLRHNVVVSGKADKRRLGS